MYTRELFSLLGPVAVAPSGEKEVGAQLEQLEEHDDGHSQIEAQGATEASEEAFVLVRRR